MKLVFGFTSTLFWLSKSETIQENFFLYFLVFLGNNFNFLPKYQYRIYFYPENRMRQHLMGRRNASQPDTVSINGKFYGFHRYKYITKVTIIFSPELALPYTKNPTEFSTVNVSIWGVLHSFDAYTQ